MKKSLFLLSAFVMLLFASCQPEELGNVENKNAAPELAIAKTAINVSYEEGTVTVPVDANYPNIKVTVASGASSWLSYKETKAETKAEMKTYKVVLAYTANLIATAREGKVTITLAAKSIEVTVSQAAAIPYMVTSLTSKRVNPRGETFDLTVTTNDSYTVTPNADWLTFDKTTGKVTASINGSGAERSGQLVFACEADPTVKSTLVVNQKAANVDPTLINILSIGDSYTEYTADYFLGVLASLGYTKIKLANIPFDGKTLAEVDDALNGTAKVSVHTIINGEPAVKDTLAVDLLSPDDWDAIVIQPSFDNAGVYDPTAVGSIVNLIRANCEYTPIFWNMTWAYKTGAAAEGFKTYKNNQETMYNSIAGVSSQVAQNPEFTAVIPVGTMIQNIRTSYIEENVLVDDSNLSVNIGKLAAAYMWASYLTGKDPIAASTPFVPSLRYEPDCIPAMQEAFANAVAKPFEVTPATQYPPYKMSVPEAEAKAIIEEAGYKFEDYVAAPFTVLHYGFYNSLNGSYLTSSVFKGFSDGNMNKYAATYIIPKAEIPNGSLLVVLEGYQYRPEGWVTLDTKNASRPDNVSTTLVKVDDAWWGTFTYRAFNISKTSGTPTAAEMRAIGTKFGIYVPKIAVDNGLEHYEPGTWEW